MLKARTLTLPEALCLAPIPAPPSRSLARRHPAVALVLREGASRASRLRRTPASMIPKDRTRVYDGEAVMEWYTELVRTGRLGGVADEDWDEVVERTTRLSLTQQVVDDFYADSR